ncbi:MAG: site-2 protease family protein [Spirochaetales bacterium]|jgi:Zn-dependent protease|nr:site-2 protease family protein [Spirochaetales bacterium]
MDFDIERMLYTLPAVIIGLGLHEWAHAFTAWKLGDVTAKEEGRVSFNPLRHLDPLGFIFIVFVGFGWAKPVRFNPENLSHPRRDRALIAAAGPVSNLLLGLAVLGFLKLLLMFLFTSMFIMNLPPKVLDVSLKILLHTAATNLGLFIFNILPVPPLDGSHIFFSSLKLDPATEARILKFGGLALFILILLENRLATGILPIHIFVNKVFSLFGFG